MKVKINLMNSESNNKIALVTGASRGLGKFLSLELAKKGYDIILVARTVGALEEQYDEINKLGVKSTIVPLDLNEDCLLYTSPSPRDLSTSRMPSSA